MVLKYANRIESEALSRQAHRPPVSGGLTSAAVWSLTTGTLALHWVRHFGHPNACMPWTTCAVQHSIAQRHTVHSTARHGTHCDRSHGTVYVALWVACCNCVQRFVLLLSVALCRRFLSSARSLALAYAVLAVVYHRERHALHDARTAAVSPRVPALR